MSWVEIANGSQWSVLWKREQRAECDLPSEIHQRIQDTLGDAELWLETWRDGLVDMAYEDGEVSVSMTPEQSTIWREVRAAHSRTN